MSLRVRTSGGLPSAEASDVDVSEPTTNQQSASTSQDLLNNLRKLGAERAKNRVRENRTPAKIYSCVYCGSKSHVKDSNKTRCSFDWRDPAHQDYASCYRGESGVWHMYGIPERVMEKMYRTTILRNRSSYPSLTDEDAAMIRDGQWPTLQGISGGWDAPKMRPNNAWYGLGLAARQIGVLCHPKGSYPSVLGHLLNKELGLDPAKMPLFYDFARKISEINKEDWLKMFEKVGHLYVQSQGVDVNDKNLIAFIERSIPSGREQLKISPEYTLAYGHMHMRNDPDNGMRYRDIWCAATDGNFTHSMAGFIKEYEQFAR